MPSLYLRLASAVFVAFFTSHVEAQAKASVLFNVSSPNDAVTVSQGKSCVYYQTLEKNPEASCEALTDEYTRRLKLLAGQMFKATKECQEQATTIEYVFDVRNLCIWRLSGQRLSPLPMLAAVRAKRATAGARLAFFALASISSDPARLDGCVSPACDTLRSQLLGGLFPVAYNNLFGRLKLPTPLESTLLDAFMNGQSDLNASTPNVVSKYCQSASLHYDQDGNGEAAGSWRLRCSPLGRSDEVWIDLNQRVTFFELDKQCGAASFSLNNNGVELLDQSTQRPGTTSAADKIGPTAVFYGEPPQPVTFVSSSCKVDATGYLVTSGPQLEFASFREQSPSPETVLVVPRERAPGNFCVLVEQASSNFAPYMTLRYLVISPGSPATLRSVRFGINVTARPWLHFRIDTSRVPPSIKCDASLVQPVAEPVARKDMLKSSFVNSDPVEVVCEAQSAADPLDLTSLLSSLRIESPYAWCRQTR